MSFFARVASLATITLAAAITLGASSPGHATDILRTNPSMVASVPITPAEMTPIVPAVLVTTGPGTLPLPHRDDALPVEPTPSPRFASLSAAVDAQPGAGGLSEDIACLAGAVFFESRGEPLAGQLAVAEVILNRSRSGRFPRSVCGVVTQPGQFSFVRGGRVPEPRVGADYRTAVAVARIALADVWNSPATGAMYFHAARVSPGWARARIAAIGHHIFYR